MTVSEGSQQLAAEASVLQADIARIEKQLSQKKSFEHALDEIVKLSHVASRRNTLPGCQNELDRFFKRTRTLLRSRYTNLAFWGATERAARTIQALIPDNKLSKLLREVEEECAERRGETPAEPIRGSFLFEGQLSNEEPEPNHIDQHTGQFQQDLEQAAARVNAAIAAAQRQNGNADIPEGELEAQAIAELLLGSEAPEAHRKAPKAGKRALKQLQVIQSLDAESLARLGGQDTACSICREILGLGETALLMPCSDAHVFHPDCIKPWMQENNSCPICRHELETDDADYEYQKVVRKQQAEDDRGSANAQTHNDFLYL